MMFTFENSSIVPLDPVHFGLRLKFIFIMFARNFFIIFIPYLQPFNCKLEKKMLISVIFFFRFGSFREWDHSWKCNYFMGNYTDRPRWIQEVCYWIQKEVGFTRCWKSKWTILLWKPTKLWDFGFGTGNHLWNSCQSWYGQFWRKWIFWACHRKNRFTFGIRFERSWAIGNCNGKLYSNPKFIHNRVVFFQGFFLFSNPGTFGLVKSQYFSY